MTGAAAEPVILASASKARAAMLRAAGLVVEIQPAHVDETTLKESARAEGWSVAETADHLADLKAARISAARPDQLVLGADQMLDLKGVWLDKPENSAEAAAHLRRLSGQRHHLISAAVIYQGGARIWGYCEQAELTMRPLSEDFIRDYLAQMGEEVTHLVGCYQIEGRGAQLFSRVRGDYFTILGLPLLPVLDFLRQRGVLIS